MARRFVPEYRVLTEQERDLLCKSSIAGAARHGAPDSPQCGQFGFQVARVRFTLAICGRKEGFQSKVNADRRISAGWNRGFAQVA
jgi:hypothetical protein